MPRFDLLTVLLLALAGLLLLADASAGRLIGRRPLALPQDEAVDWRGDQPGQFFRDRNTVQFKVPQRMSVAEFFRRYPFLSCTQVQRGSAPKRLDCARPGPDFAEGELITIGALTPDAPLPEVAK